MDKGWKYKTVEDAVRALTKEFEGNTEKSLAWIDDEVSKLVDNYVEKLKVYGICDATKEMQDKLDDDMTFWLNVRQVLLGNY